MESNNIKLVIGFITYGKSTAKYLPYFLPSLKNQEFKDFSILCFDNSEEEANENVKYIKENYLEIEIMRMGNNLGFAKAYNKMIERASELSAEYFLALNPDIKLESDAVLNMIKVLENGKELGSVCPKILQWNFNENPANDGASKKINIIDSCGIKQLSALNFYDLGQSEEDKGQCDNREILGSSGAAGMYRMSALKKIKERDDYFDELMFMYEEDCDLAYRLKIAGFKSKCINDAIIYHDRTVEAKGQSNIKIALNRKNKPKTIKRLGFLHKHIIFIKYWKRQSIKEKLEILWYAFKMFIFALLFEQYLLKEYINLWKIRKKIIIYK